MSAEPQETRDPGPDPLALNHRAISQWLAEILIVRMHHVVWKQAASSSLVDTLPEQSSISDQGFIYLF